MSRQLTAATLLGLLACCSGQAGPDSTSKNHTPSPDESDSTCPSGGWCWEHGEQAAAAPPASAALTSVWSSGPEDQWAIGSAGIVLHRTVGTWVPVDVPSTESFNGVWGTGPNDVWIVGTAGMVLHKNGSTWSRVVVPTRETLNAIWGAAANDFWVAGDGGTILHRTGSSWLTVDSGATGSFRAGWGSSASDIWAVGDGGAIVHWDGTKGSRSSSGTTVHLLAVGGTGPGDAWAVGKLGMILHWNGTIWSPFASNASTPPSVLPPALQGVWASRWNDAWAVGEGGVVLHWNGIRWARDDSGTVQRDLFAIRREANNTVWAVGGGQAILRRGAFGVGGDDRASAGVTDDRARRPFEPGPFNCHPTLVLRFFTADGAKIEGITKELVTISWPGTTTTYEPGSFFGTLEADGTSGYAFCAYDHTQGDRTIVMELRDSNDCLLATASSMATVLDDITAIDLVFDRRSCF